MMMSPMCTGRCRSKCQTSRTNGMLNATRSRRKSLSLRLSWLRYVRLVTLSWTNKVSYVVREMHVCTLYYKEQCQCNRHSVTWTRRRRLGRTWQWSCRRRGTSCKQRNRPSLNSTTCCSRLPTSAPLLNARYHMCNMLYIMHHIARDSSCTYCQIGMILALMIFTSWK